MRYGKLVDNTIDVVSDCADKPGPELGEWVLCGDAGPGWTTFDKITFTPPAPPVVVDPCEWLIDIGPFFDRFGAAKMAVLTSADAGVKAILSDVQVRKWIDLKRADVASSLAYIGSKVPSVDATLQTAILNTPVTVEENLALRKLYF